MGDEWEESCLCSLLEGRLKCKNGSNNESYILQRFSGIFIRTVLFSCSLKVEVGYNLMRDL